jgi:hypothetical protein
MALLGREFIAVPDDKKHQIVFKWPDHNIRKYTRAIAGSISCHPSAHKPPVLVERRRNVGQLGFTERSIAGRDCAGSDGGREALGPSLASSVLLSRAAGPGSRVVAPESTTTRVTSGRVMTIRL